jgi:hypothetical protein
MLYGGGFGAVYVVKTLSIFSSSLLFEGVMDVWEVLNVVMATMWMALVYTVVCYGILVLV